MSWVKLDDNMPEHPKIDGLSDRAFRVHISGLAYASRQLTDGLIHRSALRKIRATPKSLGELVDSGLWHTEGDGYEINDYLEYNPTKEKVMERRRESAERLRKWRENRGK